MITIKQHELWWVALDPTLGAETQKTRPCVVLSVDPINELSQTIVIAPFLKARLKNRVYGVDVMHSVANGLDQERRIDLRGIRAVDKLRFKNRLGLLEPAYIPALNKAIKVVLGL